MQPVQKWIAGAASLITLVTLGLPALAQDSNRAGDREDVRSLPAPKRRNQRSFQGWELHGTNSGCR